MKSKSRIPENESLFKPGHFKEVGLMKLWLESEGYSDDGVPDRIAKIANAVATQRGIGANMSEKLAATERDRDSYKRVLDELQPSLRRLADLERQLEKAQTVYLRTSNGGEYWCATGGSQATHTAGLINAKPIVKTSTEKEKP